MMDRHSALLMIDVQNDFCPGGALAIAEGDQVVPVLNKYIKYFRMRRLPILATRDWHPPKSKHFKQQGGVWPDHCIQHTFGAMFHPDLELPNSTIIASKGIKPDEDGYSGFDAVDDTSRSLQDVLNSFKIKTLFIGGLATDYCVKASVLDALKNTFQVYLLLDAIKGVNLNPDDSKKAVEGMFAAGAKAIQFVELERKGFQA